MNYSKGNKKLGPQTLVMSRPVDPTCPADCFFLSNGCYAQRTERIYPHTKNFAEGNLDKLTIGGIMGLLREATASDPPKSIRIHERGDFVRPGSQSAKNPQGSLDKRYLNKWLSALAQVEKLPNIWVYTHLYDSRLLELSKFGVAVYASVNSEHDKSRAVDAGFTMFAYGTEYTKYRGKAKLPIPKRVDAFGELNVLVCPEQRLGKTTCDICRWCVTGKGSVAFVKH